MKNNTFETFEMVAKTQQGLEHILAKELEELGAKNINIHRRAVSYQGDLKMLYLSNLCLRTALRILVPIYKCKVKSEQDLYKQIQQINWSKYLNPEGSLAVEGILRSDYFNHSKYIALKTKDAIVDQYRAAYGIRPDVDLDKPDLRINVHISDDNCTVALDSSNESLHMRGYRPIANEAPLNEVTAAALLFLSEWDKQSSIINPMCGSGTILIEAGLMARNIPANFYRKDFGFFRWKNFNMDLWEMIRSESKKNFKSCDFTMYGSDIDGHSLEIARQSITRAGLSEMIRIRKADFLKIGDEENKAKGLVIINPPYGMRLKPEDIAAFYKSIGDKLKKDFIGYTAWIISANPDGMKRVGLATSKRIQVWNGQLECRFNRFDVYAGSKKSAE